VKVAVVGGGYAGVATTIELNKSKTGTDVTLFDSREQHQKITQWHKLARGESASRYETPFSDLARRFNFKFVRKTVDIPALLKDPGAALGEKFDAVVIAQGSHSPANLPGVLALDALRDDATKQEYIRNIRNQKIAVIGGGPTGVQFAFEFAARGNKVDLYEARDRLLPTFDHSLGQTALKAAARHGITPHLLTEFINLVDGHLRGKSGEKEVTGEADLVLFVPGVRSTPAFTCDTYGRIEGYPHHRFYAAGDNSYFSGRGLNTKSAQAAVRKGQHIARTLVADFAGAPVKEYTYPELGYFVSLGPRNAVGYMLSQKTAFSGAAALFMKEAIEKQYNLYLAGLNVYP
jgi:NADH:ubiquinone reductase (H+-translocating)